MTVPDVDALDTFFAATDLDLAAGAREALDADDAVTSVRAGAVIDAWSDRQAVANLLLYPGLIPESQRAGAIERALRGDDGYLTVAAGVGAGQLGRERLAEPERARLVEALLDLTSSVVGLPARRAAASLGSLAGVLDVPELLVMLCHPDPVVRQNIVCALRPHLGVTSLAELLADRDEVDGDDAATATELLREDGIDLDAPADELRLLPVLDHLPNLADWDGPPAEPPKKRRRRPW